MRGVVHGKRGTARRIAEKIGYELAGKTGTVHKIVNGRYARDRYQALFAGLAPVSNPRLVMVIVVDEPKGGVHYGGLVAAPVFSNVMGGALRLLNITPDAVAETSYLVAADVRGAGGL